MSTTPEPKKTSVVETVTSISNSDASSINTTAESSSKSRPDPSLKWGVSAPKHSSTEPPKPEESYSPEEQAKRAKLRAKGINPDLKAEMDAKVYGNGKGGIWNKVAGTSLGGSWIK